MSEETPKIGAGHVKGMMRAGVKELAQALPAFPGHSVQPVEEPGVAGNPTQADVNQEKGNFRQEMDAYRGRASGREQAEREIER